MNFDKNELCKFLVNAKKSTYAAGDIANETKNNDKSKTIIFEQGDWKYHDNYFGGEQYGGREVAFYKEQPVFIMTYYGQVYATTTDINKIYSFLMDALKLIPLEHPYRGPIQLEKNNFSYLNNFSDEIDNFSGEETILENNNEIYKAKYI